MFEGSLVAIVTPFKNGRVDEEAFKNLIEFHIENGTNGIVPCGTTGESATLTHEEHDRVIELTVEFVNKRVPVLAGTGSNSTGEAIRLTKHAKEAGADGSLQVSPYYNKPTQEGIYQHYKALNDEVGLPMIVYNIPGRTGSNILPETMARLSELDSVIGVKEATGSLNQVSETAALCGPEFVVLSGDDNLTLPIYAVGGRGVISVLANILPDRMADLCKKAKEGDFAGARKIHFELRELMGAMFIETNPIPVKTALALMGRIRDEFRLPLTPMSPQNKDKLEDILKRHKVI
jgi:4-hydroxy-tetrahydrodipicolinate synthase